MRRPPAPDETGRHLRPPLTGVRPSYTLRDIFHQAFNSPSPPAPQFMTSFHETMQVHSSVASLGFDLSQTFLIHGNPASPDLKFVSHPDVATCRGA
ncbi:MAG TPA: hypothetical protein VEB59_01285 [Gemmatimonadales bacterium]|nr:hypothetical protein [Gemmatimonadales bacterium]